jgi:hypothetical protein
LKSAILRIGIAARSLESDGAGVCALQVLQTVLWLATLAAAGPDHFWQTAQ